MSVSFAGDHDVRINVPIDPGQMTRDDDQAIDHLTKMIAPPGSRVRFGGFRINYAVADGETLDISYTGTRRRIGAGG